MPLSLNAVRIAERTRKAATSIGALNFLILLFLAVLARDSQTSQQKRRTLRLIRTGLVRDSCLWAPVINPLTALPIRSIRTSPS